MAKVLVPLADGCEEMEATVIIDILRRAGWEVTSAGISGTVVTASRGVRLIPDAAWDDIDPATFDVLALPGGGPGSEALAADSRVLDTVRAFAGEQKLVAAICAAPLALQAAGVLEGRTATCHPGVRSDLTVPTVSDARVVVDGMIVTSQAPGTAFEFALALVELIDGRPAADRIAEGLILPEGLRS
jgi:4-methyl-5(b-hydroxyethyl)-thiazole monophosphate biosynthesis